MPNRGMPMKKTPIRRSATTPRRGKPERSFVGLLVGIIVIAVLVIGSVIAIIAGRPSGEEKKNQIASELMSDTSSQTGKPSEDSFFTNVEKDNSLVHDGNLILVNYENEYTFPNGEDKLVNIYENKTDSYTVAYTDYMLDGETLDYFSAFMDRLQSEVDDGFIVVNSSYRSFEDQEDVAASYLESSGEEYVRNYVAVPGYSEHHTGLAVDLTVKYYDGTFGALKDYASLGTLNELAPEYGFVNRYPADKEDVTRISNEPWHYRYVGTPHAYLMDSFGLCLEEYVDFVKKYTPDVTMLTVSESGSIASCTKDSSPHDCTVVYYVPAEEDGATSVPVPAEALEYHISGNNVDGFIVDAAFGAAAE